MTAACNDSDRNRIDLMQQQIIQAIAGFVEIQDEHIAGLGSGSLKELSRWSEQRQKVFTKIKQVMELDGKESEVRWNLEFVGTLRTSFSQLCEKEMTLAELAAKQLKTIRQKLASMRQGKKTLGVYSQKQGTSSSPRFMSNRT